MVDGAMVDLIFIYASETDFLITAYSERGQQWLVDSANTIIIESETNAGQPPIIVGKCWIESKAEFERLYAKAAARSFNCTEIVSTMNDHERDLTSSHAIPSTSPQYCAIDDRLLGV
jgi:hypothetical protein